MTLPSPINCTDLIYHKNETNTKRKDYLPKSPTSPIPSTKKRPNSSMMPLPYNETISSLSRKYATLLKEIQETKALLEDYTLQQHKYTQLHKKQERANKKIKIKYYDQPQQQRQEQYEKEWEQKINQSEKEYQIAKQKRIQAQEQLKCLQTIYHHNFLLVSNSNNNNNNSRIQYNTLLTQLLDLIRSVKKSYDTWIYQVHYTYPYYLFLTNTIDDKDDHDPSTSSISLSSSSHFLMVLDLLKSSVKQHVEKDQYLLNDMDQSIHYFTEISNQYCDNMIL
ncbi:hypothetical protein BJ944DRAFT_272254, partial [Cunninghamella echinulata]